MHLNFWRKPMAPHPLREPGKHLTAQNPLSSFPLLHRSQCTGFHEGGLEPHRDYELGLPSSFPTIHADIKNFPNLDFKREILGNQVAESISRILSGTKIPAGENPTARQFLAGGRLLLH